MAPWISEPFACFVEFSYIASRKGVCYFCRPTRTGPYRTTVAASALRSSPAHMPWQSNADLPESVRSALPEAAQTVFREVANSQIESGASEPVAKQSAWAAVKENWERGDDDRWIAKIGARNSRNDLTDIQSIHNAAVRLGAVCEAHGPGIEKRSAERSMYVSRRLINSDEFIKWAKAQGFKTVLQPGDLHVTIAYSHAPLEWPASVTSTLAAEDTAGREVVALGDGGAVVLQFKSNELNERWDYLRSVGATWDHFQYTPHVTISWDAGDVDLTKVHPFTGVLLFGPERFNVVKDDWHDSITEKVFHVAKVEEVNEELGIVFGWAIISKIRGKEYFDVQGDHIPEDSMLVASANYMQKSRIGGHMHRYRGNDAESVERAGEVIFAFPLTTDIAKAMGIASPTTGLMIGMKVDRPDILEKFKNGTYTGFSIGGRRLLDEEVGA